MTSIVGGMLRPRSKRALDHRMPGIRRRVKDLAEKVGARLVTALGDTSSDTPDSRTAPKRQAYDQWVAEEAAKKNAVPRTEPDR